MANGGVNCAMCSRMANSLGSVGIAYTLQIIAQRDAHPAHSAIILSLKGLFAAIGGWLLLGEMLSLRGLFGCALMLAGMVFSEMSSYFGKQKPANQQISVVANMVLR